MTPKKNKTRIIIEDRYNDTTEYLLLTDDQINLLNWLFDNELLSGGVGICPLKEMPDFKEI